MGLGPLWMLRALSGTGNRFSQRELSVFWDMLVAVALLEPTVAENYRLALLRIGTSLGRSRGPFGESISASDTQLLLLVAELLEIRSARLSDDLLV